MMFLLFVYTLSFGSLLVPIIIEYLVDICIDQQYNLFIL